METWTGAKPPCSAHSCRSRQTPDPRRAQRICCSESTDPISQSWIHAITQKNSRCAFTQSFIISHLIFDHPMQWVGRISFNSPDSRRSRNSILTSATARSMDPIFQRPASPSPRVLAVFTESLQKGQEICS